MVPSELERLFISKKGGTHPAMDLWPSKQVNFLWISKWNAEKLEQLKRAQVLEDMIILQKFPNL